MNRLGMIFAAAGGLGIATDNGLNLRGATNSDNFTGIAPTQPQNLRQLSNRPQPTVNQSSKENSVQVRQLSQ